MELTLGRRVLLSRPPKAVQADGGSDLPAVQSANLVERQNHLRWPGDCPFRLPKAKRFEPRRTSPARQALLEPRDRRVCRLLGAVPALGTWLRSPQQPHACLSLLSRRVDHESSGASLCLSCGGERAGCCPEARQAEPPTCLISPQAGGSRRRDPSATGRNTIHGLNHRP